MRNLISRLGIKDNSFSPVLSSSCFVWVIRFSSGILFILTGDKELLSCVVRVQGRCATLDDIRWHKMTGCRLIGSCPCLPDMGCNPISLNPSYPFCWFESCSIQTPKRWHMNLSSFDACPLIRALKVVVYEIASTDSIMNSKWIH